MVIFFQALFLALGFLLLNGFGATYVATIGGLLTLLWRSPFAPFTLIFAVLYGLMVDAFSHSLRVKRRDEVRTRRIVASIAISTALMGFISYYVTVHIFALLPRKPLLEAVILMVGAINGVAAGYVAAFIWRSYLRPFAQK